MGPGESPGELVVVAMIPTLPTTRVNTIEPRAAVLSEGAAALVGDSIRPDQVESIEQMVEAVVALRDCAPYITAHSYVSLDLIDE